MQLKLTKNVNKGVLTVQGPQVSFQLGDAGQANVAVHVVAHGEHFHFPLEPGEPPKPSATFAPGEYACTVMVAAFSHGAMGTSYDSSVSIGGKPVATARGDVAADSEEHASRTFALQVL